MIKKTKTSRKLKIGISILMIISGWILNAFAWTTKIGHPLSTICLLLGLGLFFGGIIFMIIIIVKKAQPSKRGVANSLLSKSSL